MAPTYNLFLRTSTQKKLIIKYKYSICKEQYLKMHTKIYNYNLIIGDILRKHLKI